jgi:hypothetical protein
MILFHSYVIAADGLNGFFAQDAQRLFSRFPAGLSGQTRVARLTDPTSLSGQPEWFLFSDASFRGLGRHRQLLVS